MKISKEELLTLANLIVNEIKKDFENKRLSGNLVNTIIVTETSDGYQIEIPAETYKMYQWFAHKVVVHDGKGSYATELNKTGSKFMVYPKHGKRYLAKPHNHKGYVDKAISNSIEKWKLLYANKYEVANELKSK